MKTTRILIRDAGLLLLKAQNVERHRSLESGDPEAAANLTHLHNALLTLAKVTTRHEDDEPGDTAGATTQREGFRS